MLHVMNCITRSMMTTLLHDSCCLLGKLPAKWRAGQKATMGDR
jgi:hypothetical protein